MAKVTSIFTFTGTVDGISVYSMRGIPEKVARKSWGPSREDIETKPSYDITRRNDSEHGGCSKASKWLRRNFRPLEPVRDHTLSGPVTGWMKSFLDLDTDSELGRRQILITRNPRLLEGINLSKRFAFDSVVRGGIDYRMNRETLSAVLRMPALLPGLNLALPDKNPYYRVVATLGAAPDVFWTPLGYAPQGDYSGFSPGVAESDWFPSASRSDPFTLELTLPYTPPTEHFSLVLTVGILMGTVSKSRATKPVKYAGCGKVLAAV